MKWTKDEGRLELRVWLYRIRAEDDKWHMDMPVNGGMFAELSQAKTWCSEH